MPFYKDGSPVIIDKPIALFGCGVWAEYCAATLVEETGCSIAAFTAHDAYCNNKSLNGAPVIPLSQFYKNMPPETCHVFVSAGYSLQNNLREKQTEWFLAKGYSVLSYVSQGAVVWPNIKVHTNVAIHDKAIVQPFCEIATNTHILSGAIISHHTKIAQNCFIASGASIAGEVSVGRNCMLGINSTIREKVTIGDYVTLGAGAVLVNDALEPGTYVGMPARMIEAFDVGQLNSG